MERDGKWFYYYHPYETPTKPTPDCDDFFERYQEYNRHPMNPEQVCLPFDDNYDNSIEYVQEFSNILETTPDVHLRASMQAILNTGQYLQTYVQPLSVKTHEGENREVDLEEPPEHLTKKPVLSDLTREIIDRRLELENPPDYLVDQILDIARGVIYNQEIDRRSGLEELPDYLVNQILDTTREFIYNQEMDGVEQL